MSLTWVGIISLIILVAIVAWDIVLKIDEDSKTISAGSRYLARAISWWPIFLPFAFGVLSGHFFLADWGDAGQCQFWCD